MKTVVLFTLSILIVWFIIIKLAPNESIVILDENTIEEMHRSLTIRRVLWGVMILLELFLCYRLYVLISALKGRQKLAIQVYFIMVIGVLVISSIILIISFTSFWF